MKKLWWQLLLLVLSFTFVFLWQLSSFSKNTLQLAGGMIIIYLLVSLVRRKLNPMELLTSESWSIFFLNTVLILLIFATGVFSSFLFFLLYFLAFGIAFVFEPITVFVFVIGAILVFLPYVDIDDVTGNILHIGSLLAIAPLAFWFGLDYKKKEQAEQNTKENKESLKKKVSKKGAKKVL